METAPSLNAKFHHFPNAPEQFAILLARKRLSAFLGSREFKELFPLNERLEEERPEDGWLFCRQDGGTRASCEKEHV